MSATHLTEALARVRQAPLLLDGYRATARLVEAAAEAPAEDAVDLLIEAITDLSDQLTRIAAVHALGAVTLERAGVVLCDLLSDKEPFIREHAAWAIGSQLPQPDAIGRLVSLVADGGFSGVLAQRTLATWADRAPDFISLTLEGAMIAATAPAARARLVETLGLVPGRIAVRLLRRTAAAPDEPADVRRAAVAAIGDRRDDAFAVDVIHQLAGAGDELAADAQLAAYDLAPQRPRTRTRNGLTVAQLFLHADLDRSVSMAGAGDNGGVATLLVRLGGALVEQYGVDRVLTLSRGGADGAARSLVPREDHELVSIPLLSTPLGSTQAWPAWIAAERAIRRALIAQGPVDVIHLRMAEVGSMAAAAAAQSLGIPIVFTLAPDPHSVIHSLDMSGSMSRADFGLHDAREHFWFRLRLVRTLADSAAKVVLFPRAELTEDLKDLVGIDITDEPGRFEVVPEGIDITVTARALQEAVAFADRRAGSAPISPTVDAFDELGELVRGLPPHRQGLPLAISVGRLHRVKGMATVAQAWAEHPALRDRCNLLVVGGDLARPSEDERGQLGAIDSVLQRHPEAAAGFLLAGHRSNDTVARWLAATRTGLGPAIGPAGIYVCGSLKEEFGLAILEALATGLVVVAPDAGGPATYIEHGRTGVLVRTSDTAALAEGMCQALDLAVAPDRSVHRGRAQHLVDERFTVQAMASTLATLYTDVTVGRSESRPETPEMFGLSKILIGSRSAARP
ncbi:glycosyltransferase [Nakamurella silvestris]|nr:glycosyltransferase [Nakamurella silvestris]